MTLLAQPMSELQRMHQFLQGSSRFPHTSFREAEVGLSVLFSLKGSLGLLVQLPHVTTARVTNPATCDRPNTGHPAEILRLWLGWSLS